MAPMTRSKSPGRSGSEVAAYYRRRAEGGVGLIVTEGTYVPHPGAGAYPDVPLFYGEKSRRMEAGGRGSSSCRRKNLPPTLARGPGA